MSNLKAFSQSPLGNFQRSPLGVRQGVKVRTWVLIKQRLKTEFLVPRIAPLTPTGGYAHGFITKVTVLDEDSPFIDTERSVAIIYAIDLRVAGVSHWNSIGYAWGELNTAISASDRELYSQVEWHAKVSPKYTLSKGTDLGIESEVEEPTLNEAISLDKYGYPIPANSFYSKDSVLDYKIITHEYTLPSVLNPDDSTVRDLVHHQADFQSELIDNLNPNSVNGYAPTYGYLNNYGWFEKISEKSDVSVGETAFEVTVTISDSTRPLRVDDKFCLLASSSTILVKNRFVLFTVEEDLGDLKYRCSTDLDLTTYTTPLNAFSEVFSRSAIEANDQLSTNLDTLYALIDPKIDEIQSYYDNYGSEYFEYASINPDTGVDLVPLELTYGGLQET